MPSLVRAIDALRAFAQPASQVLSTDSVQSQVTMKFNSILSAGLLAGGAVAEELTPDKVEADILQDKSVTIPRMQDLN